MVIAGIELAETGGNIANQTEGEQQGRDVATSLSQFNPCNYHMCEG
jgi:hypothetical protein